MSTQDGGCAFPTVLASPRDFPDGSTFQNGLSIRDWFAGQALSGIVAHGDHLNMIKEGETSSEIMRLISGSAYKFADAMLAERNKGDRNE
jgi:hypothetical protein